MIHPTALVNSDATIAPDVEVGPFTIIHANTTIGGGARLGSHCEVGLPTPRAQGRRLKIGAGSLIRSHSVIYEGSDLGDFLETGHHVTIRENVVAGANLRVGSWGDIQGDSSIGDYVRMQSNVFIAQGSTVGSFVWLYPFVVFTNDERPPSEGPYQGPFVESYAVVATKATLLPGIRVGRHAYIAAHSLVTSDVPSGTFVKGCPAKRVGPVSAMTTADGSQAYPWPQRFTRGYPREVTDMWKHSSGWMEGAS